MIKLKNINNRDIYITKYNDLEKLPNSNWCLIIIADEKDINTFSRIISTSIDHSVSCIVGIGKQSELIHDLADEELVYREVDPDGGYLPKHLVMTTWDQDFEEGIWNSFYITYNEEGEVRKVVIFDLTESYSELLVELLDKINNGYIPSKNNT